MINRTSRARINVVVSLGSYIVQLLLSMVVRVFFIRKLGAEYLGLNGVLTSTLSMLSLVDLGLDSIFIFTLFRPLKDNNTELIKSIMRLYRDTFRIIAASVLIVGLGIAFFLPAIIGVKGMRLHYVYPIYFLFLANSVASYLMSYNRSIINANQQSFIVNGLTSAAFIGVNLFQLASLLLVPSPLIYVAIQLMGTIVMNLLITQIARHYFPFLRESKVVPLAHVDKVIIFKNSIGGFSSKVGSLIVFGSDNIILSIFSNLTVVGIYSNYTVITNAILALLQKISVSLTPSVGNLGVEDDPKRNRDILAEIIFILYAMIAVGYSAFVTLLSFFMIIWVGKGAVFPPLTELLIALVLILQLVRVPFWIYIDAFGLQWIQRWKSIIEAAVNLCLTLFFVWYFKMGVNGVLLGTILSTILTVSWIEPYIIYKYPLKGRFDGIISLLTKFGSIFLIQTVGAYLLNYYFVQRSFGIVLIKLLIILGVTFGLLGALFHRTNYLQKLSARLLKRY